MALRTNPARAALAAAALFLAPAGCAGPYVVEADAAERIVRMEDELAARGNDYGRRWELASACLDIVDHPGTDSRNSRLDYAERALRHADAAVALEPHRVEGHYFRAVALGRVLEHSILRDLGMIGELEAAGRRARQIDPAFRCAGPLRLLALLYQKAPPWPLGPESAGEEDIIERLFQEAIRLAPECPENRLCYAEFLRENDRRSLAREEALEARRLLAGGGEEFAPHELVELSRRVGEVLDPKFP